MAALGSLFVSLGLDAAEFTGGLSKAEHQINQFVNATAVRIGVIQGIVAEGVHGLVEKLVESVKGLAEIIPKSIESTAALKELAEQSGNTVESISALSDLAGATGQSFEPVNLAMIKLAKNLSTVKSDASPVAEALKGIGLSAADLIKENPAKQLEDIAVALAKFSDEGAGKPATAALLLGKAGAQLLPYLKNLGEASEAGRLEASVTDQQAEAAKAYERNLASLNLEKQKLIRTVSTALIPVLTGVVKAFAEMSGSADGVRGKIKGLAEDGSITDFAEKVANSLGSVVDFFDAFARVIELTGNLIAGFAAVTVERLSSLNEAGLKLQKFEFSGAAAEYQAGTDRIKGISEKFAADQEKILSKPYFGEALKAQITAARAKFDAPEEAGAKRPSLTVPTPVSAGSAAAGDELIRKQLEGRLKAIQAAADAEKQALDAEGQFYDRFHSENLVSTATYYDARQRIADSALAVEVTAINKQIDEERAAQAKFEKETSREDSANKIADFITKRSKLEAEAATKTALLTFDRRKSNEEYLKELNLLNAQVLELEGHLAKAAGIRFDEQNKSLVQKLTISGNQEGIDQVAKLRAAEQAQKNVNEETAKASLLESQLSNVERRIALEQQAGTLSELGAATKLTEARQKSVVELQAIADKYKAIAASADPNTAEGAKMIQAADDFQLRVEELSASADVLKNKFKDMFVSGATNFFSSIIDGSKTAKQAFSDFAKSVGAQITQLVSQELATNLFKTVSGAAGGASGSGTGWAGLFASVFSSGAAGALAGGGPAGAGNIYQVAEQGPEVLNTGGKSYLLMGKESGNVVPFRGGGGAGGNVTIVQNFPPGTDRRTVDQAARQAGQLTQRALRRDG